MLTIMAPAKINLTLEVVGKRDDGFHEIRSVMQTVSLGDVLSFSEADKTTIQCDKAGWSAEKSLVKGTVNLLREVTGCTRGATINITKKITLMSGLGGDSSDAAAVLKGLNEIWGLGLSLEEQSVMAAELGSDVPFFLRGGTALVEGRGEEVTPLPALPKMWVVLVEPDTPVKAGKTARMYRSLKAPHYTDGAKTEKIAAAIRRGEILDISLLFNTFENTAFDDFNIRRVYVEHLLKLGAPHVHLAGAGPTLFTMFNEKIQAEDLYNRCKDQGMEVYLEDTYG
jgi:4-diphosphocytidyl-2-C-methyl-D-erythritol kinase